MLEDPREMIQKYNVHRSVVPGILSQLFICSRGGQFLPRVSNKPLQGWSSGELFDEFKGGDNSLDVKVGAKEIGIDNGSSKRIRAR